MSEEVLGTIKFFEDKIITKKNNGKEEVWKKQRNVGLEFIKWNGYLWTLQNSESTEELGDDDINIDINEDWD
jgi:hypothetical protein